MQEMWNIQKRDSWGTALGRIQSVMTSIFYLTASFEYFCWDMKFDRLRR